MVISRVLSALSRWRPASADPPSGAPPPPEEVTTEFTFPDARTFTARVLSAQEANQRLLQAFQSLDGHGNGVYVRGRVRDYIDSFVKEPFFVEHDCEGPEGVPQESYAIYGFRHEYPRPFYFTDLTNFIEHHSEYHHSTTGSDEKIIEYLETYAE